jgi:hypothetical protein
MHELVALHLFWNLGDTALYVFGKKHVHSWAKFKIRLVRKSWRKNHCLEIQFFKVVFFPSNFWNIIVIWQFSWVILNFVQECYHLENKVGEVDFIKIRWLVKFQSPPALVGPLGIKTLPFLEGLQNLLLSLYFWGNVPFPSCRYRNKIASNFLIATSKINICSMLFFI